MTYEQLINYLAEFKKISVEKIEKNTRLVEDLGLDSLDIVQMLYDAEKRFSIYIPSEKIEELKTVEKLYNFICE